MKKHIFQNLAKLNKKILPSYSKKRLDLGKANAFQKGVLGWKLWVTKNALVMLACCGLFQYFDQASFL